MCGRQGTIPPQLGGVVLVTKESKGLAQVDALPDWVFMQAWKAANIITHVLPTRPFRLFIINTSKAPLTLPKNQGVATAILSLLFNIHCKID